MSMVYISVHDVSPELYEQLPVEEITHETSMWKRIVTPSMSLTVFRPEPVGVEVPERETVAT